MDSIEGGRHGSRIGAPYKNVVVKGSKHPVDACLARSEGLAEERVRERLGGSSMLLLRDRTVNPIGSLMRQ